MKNHKGAIATLLTLGLVVIGTLITLGTSLFVNNQNTNLASNSMAYTNPCLPFRCPENSAITAYKRGGTIYKYSDCTGAFPYAQICSPVAAPPAQTGSGSTLPGGVTAGTCPYTSTVDATNKCKPYGYTNEDCPGKRLKCKPASEADSTTSSSGGSGGGTSCPYTSTVDATNKCKPYGYTNEDCPGKRLKCKPASEADSTTTSSGGGSGDIGPGQSCCFAKKGLIYVYATYDSLVANEMVDDAGNPDCARQSAGVINSYGADSRGAFTCSGGIQNQTPEDEIDPADLDGTTETDVPDESVNTCETDDLFQCKTFSINPNNSCSPSIPVNLSCGSTTEQCCTKAETGGNNGGSGVTGESCAFGTFHGRANTYYCVSPDATCSNGICIASQTSESDLPTTNNTDDQKCIDRFQTPYAYCSATGTTCIKTDNVNGKALKYVNSGYLCASGFLGKRYNCCVRSDANQNQTNASTNRLLPTAIPDTNDAGDDQKCKDAYRTEYAFCTATICGPRDAVINGKSYSYKQQKYVCNINVVGKDFYCCVAEPFINNLSVTSDTTSVQTPVTTSGGERGNIINLPGGPAFVSF